MLGIDLASLPAADLFFLSLTAAAFVIVILVTVFFIRREMSTRAKKRHLRAGYFNQGRYPRTETHQAAPPFSWAGERKVQESGAEGPAESDLRWKLEQIEDLLQHLQQVQEQTIRHNDQLNKTLLESVEKLVKLAEAWNPPESRPPAGVPQMHAKEVHDQDRREETVPSPGSPDPEQAALELLRLIEPAGRLAPLARLSGVEEWLKSNYPSIKAESIGMLNQDLWLLLVLTADSKAGVVVPALDSIIGPGEVLKWFEGGRYDGTQALLRANISSLAKAVWDGNAQRWQPDIKGRIDLR